MPIDDGLGCQIEGPAAVGADLGDDRLFLAAPLLEDDEPPVVERDRVGGLARQTGGGGRCPCPALVLGMIPFVLGYEPAFGAVGAASVERVRPAQAREPPEIPIGRTQLCAMLDGERRQMRV